MNLQPLKRDFVERFMNFETLKGLYMLPLGAFIIWVALFHEQYSYKLVLILLGAYMAHEGLRKIFVNRIKQEARTRKLVNERMSSEKYPF